jgi:hypothetical protein
VIGTNTAGKRCVHWQVVLTVQQPGCFFYILMQILENCKYYLNRKKTNYKITGIVGNKT